MSDHRSALPPGGREDGVGGAGAGRGWGWSHGEERGAIATGAILAPSQPAAGAILRRGAGGGGGPVRGGRGSALRFICIY